jgi:hypothetical protein
MSNPAFLEQVNNLRRKLIETITADLPHDMNVVFEALQSAMVCFMSQVCHRLPPQYRSQSRKATRHEC